jgi:hypothetical protein
MFCCCLPSTSRNDKVIMLPEDDDICCWICLEQGSETNELKQVCKCQTLVHEKCIRKWQLVKQGTFEEHSCRFCKVRLDTLPIPRKVNVFFRDCYLGEVTINYTYEYFKQCLHKAIDHYNFDSSIVIEFVCRKGVNKTNISTGSNVFDIAQSHDILFVRISLKDEVTSSVPEVTAV